MRRLIAPLTRLLLAVLVAACSGAAVQSGPTAAGDLPVAPAGRRTLATAAGSIDLPPGLRRVDDQTWALPLANGQVIGLRLQVQSDPDGAAMAQLDQQIRAMEKTGQAGVERDAVVQLGDLDARLVQAVDLDKANPQALWLLVAIAEDGVYTASVAGPAAEVRQRRALLEAFLLSLRIPPPAKAQPPVPAADPLADDVTPGSLP